MRECSRQGKSEHFLGQLSPGHVAWLLYDWEVWARDDQLPSDKEFVTWLLLGGRGAGKTRAGAEWVKAIALGNSQARIALIGETLGDARSVMVEGVSGLLSVHADHERPKFEPSKKQITWNNGAVARLFSAEDPESLRGPQHSHIWSDETAKWKYADQTFDMAQFGLRLGKKPQQVVTTTPRPIPLLKRLLEEPTTVVSKATTDMNAANLAPSFLDTIVGRYRGTRLGRQELDAEILEDRPDALWPRALIEQCRVSTAPELERIVVAVDPPVTSGKRSDACGIIVAGRGPDGRAFVLRDATLERAAPTEWARAVAAAYHRAGADRVVAEVNQGGELVAAMIAQVDASIPVRMVRATRGKWLRAEPVAALYEQGRVAHVGAFPELEDQMADFGRDGLSGNASPDRVDDDLRSYRRRVQCRRDVHAGSRRQRMIVWLKYLGPLIQFLAGVMRLFAWRGHRRLGRLEAENAQAAKDREMLRKAADARRAVSDRPRRLQHDPHNRDAR